MGLAIQSNGKIVAAGYSDSYSTPDSNSDFELVRYNSDGSLDTSFGGTGKVIIPVGNSGDYANSVAIQSDGKIVAAGESFTNTDTEFAVVRVNSNGSLDTTFNGTGKVVTDTIGNSAATVAIQADGKIVAAGGYSDEIFGFVLVRYQGGPNANTRTRFDFDGDGRADISVFRPSDRIWYLNRSTAGFAATQFGLSTDKITPADFDGDGKTDIAVYRPSTGTWYVLNSGNGTVSHYVFGLAEDLPTPADYDGDGKADISAFRPSDGTCRLNS